MVIIHITPPKHLMEAARDYKYLLDRGFNRDHALRFIGDHYTLKKEERLILYRSIHPSSHVARVSPKIINTYPLEEPLYIDFYNVILTITAMLRGQQLYLGNDGFIRDMSGVHGRIRDVDLLSQAINIFKELITQLSPPRTTIFLESQVSKSGEYRAFLARILGDETEVILTRNVDSTLYDVSGIVATSDSIIHLRAEKLIDIPQLYASTSNMEVNTVDFQFLR
jgi:hypothetical protein